MVAFTIRNAAAAMMAGSIQPAYSHANLVFGWRLFSAASRWWLGPVSGIAEEVTQWRRPYRGVRAGPKDVWMMAQPLTLPGDTTNSDSGAIHSPATSIGDRHVFVGDGAVYTAPLYRLAGLYSPANGEFNTPAFVYPARKDGTAAQLWLNADASWQKPLQTGGCDEGCAAYLFCELRYASGNNSVVPGFEADRFATIMNATGAQLPLVWTPATPPPVGTRVLVRIYFRDAVVYALGHT